MNTKLIKAVKKQLSDSPADADDLLYEISQHLDASAGWPGFTYYTDTCKFYDENHEEIWEALSEDADLQGCTPMELIASFGCVNSIIDDQRFKNALAWYALEAVALDYDNR